MRHALLAVLFLATAGAAAAEPRPAPGAVPMPGPTPFPGGGPSLRCTDLAIIGYNYARSAPGGPLGPNDVAIYWHVRNNGPFAYASPSESKQWISLEVLTPAGARQVGVSVLPADGSGPVSLARGASWRGHLRGTVPADVARPYPPMQLRLNYAGADGSWRPPLDCNVSNNTMRAPYG